MVRLAAALLAVSLAPGAACAGDGFADIAKGIGRAAERAGVKKVQILPLVSVDGEATAEGRMVASRIMAELIDQGKVLIVDGDLPSSIPDPYRVAMGLKAKKNVRPEADAVVMGTHMTGARKIHVDIQLLRVRDRVVLFSANRGVKNEWEGAMAWAEFKPAPQKRDAPAPVMASMGPDLFGDDRDSRDNRDLAREAFAEEEDDDCRSASVEVDRLQRSILDIKARYVARKLKESRRKMSQRPDPLIQDPELRSQFEMSVADYLRTGDIPPLSKRDVQTMLIVDGKSFEIHRRCLLDGSARLDP